MNVELNMSRTAVTVLGSTGTIGINTLDVIARHPDRYRVFALSANKNVDLALKQCKSYRPDYVVMVDEDAAHSLSEKLAKDSDGITTVLSGEKGLETIVTDEECDTVMASIVGAAGLMPTIAAARAGKRILLANKESLVMSGELLMSAVRDNGATLLPVDSEHNAIWQCLPAQADEKGDAVVVNNARVDAVSKVFLTASGGPFKDMPLAHLDSVTPDQACAHPNWRMGRKISVDSATMMNKGLELIEACWLFNIDPDCIQVIVHPESIVHSMVAYCDGSVMAQLSNPDMRTPIAYALAWPERIDAGVEPLDLFAVANLSFEYPDYERFPCLLLAQEAAVSGGTCSTMLNAANEVAVAGFLDRKIKFTDIPKIVEKVLGENPSHSADSLEDVLEDDRLARAAASQLINSYH